MSIIETLTGNTQYRVQKKRFSSKYYLVLQVEVHKKGDHIYHIGTYIESEFVDYTYWRDARTEDLGILC